MIVGIVRIVSYYYLFLLVLGTLLVALAIHQSFDGIPVGLELSVEAR